MGNRGIGDLGCYPNSILTVQNLCYYVDDQLAMPLVNISEAWADDKKLIKTPFKPPFAVWNNI